MGAAEQAERLGFDAARLGRIDDWMARYVDSGKLPGAAVCILRRGEVAWRARAGMRDVDAGAPWTDDTLVRIYSMTKPVATVGLMTLYEEGLFRLDDPVADYLPELAGLVALRPGAERLDDVEPLARPLTVHHLLTHTAGFTYGFNGGVLGAAYEARRVGFGPRGAGLQAAVRRLAEMPLAFQPGARWNYGVSTDVVGRLVEVLSGRTLDVCLRERVLAPLGMDDTGFACPRAASGRLAALYETGEGGGMARVETGAESAYLEGRVATFSAGGGLISTMADYARFAEMLRRGGALDGVRLLAPRTVRFMTQNHLPGDLVGHQDPVGQLGSRAAQQRPLAPILVARAAEKGNEATGSLRAQRPQTGLQRGRRVRKVHDDAERLAAIDDLHPSGHGRDARQRRHRIVDVAADRPHARRGGGNVGSIPGAHEIGRDGQAAPGGVQRHLAAPVVEFDPLGLHVGRRSRAKRDHVAARVPREPRHDRIVGIENRRATPVGGGSRVQQVEQTALRAPVALDAAVKVEMLMGHVGNHRAIEAKAVHALELQRVRRHFEHRPVDPGIQQLAQLPGDHRRLGGREPPGGPAATRRRARCPRWSWRRQRALAPGASPRSGDWSWSCRPYPSRRSCPGSRSGSPHRRRASAASARRPSGTIARPDMRGHLDRIVRPPPPPHRRRCAAGDVGVAVVAQPSPCNEAGAGPNLSRIEMHRLDRPTGRLE